MVSKNGGIEIKDLGYRRFNEISNASTLMVQNEEFQKSGLLWSKLFLDQPA